LLLLWAADTRFGLDVLSVAKRKISFYKESNQDHSALCHSLYCLGYLDYYNSRSYYELKHKPSPHFKRILLMSVTSTKVAIL
jgi:hypothetical protein